MQEMDLLGVRVEMPANAPMVCCESAMGRSRPYRPDLHRGA